MGIVIKATGISGASNASSIDNAVEAARNCLQQSGIDHSQVDLLINIGIYRDDNIMEPSIAALIQQRLELNPDPVKNDIRARTFSFDLMNGACGFLNAVEVAQAMLQAGVYRNVLVVGGDVHPSRGVMPGFPFTGVGGAALLGYCPDEQAGFGPVQALSRTEDDYVGYLCQGVMQDFGSSGRQHGMFHPQPEYQARFCQHLAESVRRFLRAQAASVDQIDMLVTSQIEAGFPAQLATNLELPGAVDIVDAYPELGDPHSSVPIIGMHELQQRGLWQPGKRILFALVGSGIATTCALYRVQA